MHTVLILIMLFFLLTHIFALILLFSSHNHRKQRFINAIRRENHHACGVYILLVRIVSTENDNWYICWNILYIRCSFYSLCIARSLSWKSRFCFCYFRALWSLGIHRFGWYSICHRMEHFHLLQTSWRTAKTWIKHKNAHFCSWIYKKNRHNLNSKAKSHSEYS